jgi:hypothetical protein
VPRGAEFVGGAGSQGAHGHHPFVAQRLFARGSQFGIALANLAGHATMSQPIMAVETTKISHMPSGAGGWHAWHRPSAAG